MKNKEDGVKFEFHGEFSFEFKFDFKINLGYADLGYANLRYADLGYANLGYADLRYADLGYADLGYADLRSTNLDFSSGISFTCKHTNFKADIRMAAQLAWHFRKIDFSYCEDAEEIKKYQKLLTNLSDKFHLVQNGDVEN